MLLILAAGVLGRFLITCWFISHSEAAWVPDSGLYWELGQNLADGSGFVRRTSDGVEYETLRTPGYPFLLACIFRLAGPGVAGVLLFQFLVTCGTVFLTFLIGRHMGSLELGVGAALLILLSPAQILLDNQILSENLFTLMMLASLWTVYRIHPRGMLFFLAFSGLMMGAAVLVRPFGIFLFVPMSVFLLLRKGRITKSGLLATAIWLTGFSLPLVCWMTRNEVRTGHTGIASVRGYNLLVFHAATIEARRSGESCDSVASRLMDEDGLNQPGKNWSWPEDDQAGQRALGIITNHPVELLKETPRSFRRLYLGETPPFYERIIGWEGTDRRGSRRFFFLAWVLMQWTVLAFCIVLSLLQVWRVPSGEGRRFHWHILSLAVYPFLLIAGTCAAHYRFRAPFEPLIAMMTAGGLMTLARVCALSRRGSPE